MTRRTFLSAALLAGRPALGATELQVAYAGSMASAMEGPIGRAAEAMGLKLQGRAQGASGLAQLIVAGSLRPDVFISITPSPMQTVQRAGKARRAVPIARTEMVIAYSPHSRFRAEFERAARDPEGHPWWRVLGAKGLRFGRTDPITDPQGRNILFVFQLDRASVRPGGPGAAHSGSRYQPGADFLRADGAGAPAERRTRCRLRLQDPA